ncbi:hypothetical protein D187_002457 [Cystobacter fuscus DSM 2262]|uniref:Uncharacterized protein n=1 Tax=Cystobacter fuscus (strain ATCC 25194 / DSM 2262 / NBRC 100088 / M29) TaxID=1242864 RepID=S9QSU5_CYSF2|nr:hypothetical protein D187_002457 [Cystobacter fuscus DSM 2262]
MLHARTSFARASEKMTRSGILRTTQVAYSEPSPAWSSPGIARRERGRHAVGKQPWNSLPARTVPCRPSDGILTPCLIRVTDRAGLSGGLPGALAGGRGTRVAHWPRASSLQPSRASPPKEGLERIHVSRPSDVFAPSVTRLEPSSVPSDRVGDG